MFKIQSSGPRYSLRRRIFARATPVACAYFATLLAIPVNAGITLPTAPLTTAARVPPNVLFVLDDSGSMAWRYMYNPDIASLTGGGITSLPTGNNTSANSTVLTTDTRLNAVYDQSYVTNTIYYNPNIPYVPWVDSAGTPLSGGTTMEAAYSDDVFVSNNLAGTTSNTTNLTSATHTFYAPKANATNLADATQYYRYQILTNGRVVRSERIQGVLTVTPASGVLATGLSGNASSNRYVSIAIPAQARNLVFTTSSTANCNSRNQCADLYVSREAQPRPNSAECSGASQGSNNESCSFASPIAGTYTANVYGGSAYSGVTLRYSYELLTDNNGEASVGCDTTTSGWGWRNCTYARPADRTEDAEKANFATWYSYYRTRTKAAKGGAASAFNGLGTDVRVGFRTIWGRNGATTTQNTPTQSVPIPVAYNQGLFDNPAGVSGVNNNRARWYNRLFAATATDGTPLRSALNNAGLYYSSSSSSGPYGPASGADQLQCRQNFTIMTTDGYWNGDDNFSSGGNQDGNNGAAIERPDRTTYTYVAGRPYSDQVSNTLADVAMRYWKNDLRTDMSNIVPTTGLDPAFWQHMVTFGISIGLKGTLNPDTDLPDITSGRRSWTTPSANGITTIDDLWHASVNGRGRFIAASNPGEFAEGLKAALDSVVQRTGSFSNVSANSTSVTIGTRVFQATYVSGVWTGEVGAYAIGTDNRIATTASWVASQNVPTSNRKVFTSDGAAGLAFPASATNTQIADLTRTGTSNYPVTGAENASYIAGDRSRELQNTGNLRNRVHVLGDVVSSSPAYVSDTNTLYVGANDGMLHAFNAESGVELFGFIPNSINWADLNTLSRPDYGHRFFVDGPIIVSNRAQTPNKNILVGALGKGGKGLFSLDVTNPSAFGTANFKWEVGRNDADMGLVQGRPFIARLNNGSTVVIASNGLNSTNGRAVLFVYDLESGALIRKIDTGVGSAVTDSADSNGLSEPVGWDSDGNGSVDYVYAGDLLGNVWKFDLSAATSSTWGIAGNAPIFSATYTGSDPAIRQPITGGITVALHPTTFRTWIFFGTGRLITTGDMTSRSVQSIYGFVEDGSLKRRSGASANLTARGLVLIDGARRTFEPNAALPATSKGWYVDLLTPPNATVEGERIVSGAQLLRTNLIFSSVIPTASACTPDGTGFLNSLDAFTGTSTSSPFFDVNGNGSFADDTLATTDGRAIPIGSVNLGVGMTTQANLLQGLATVGGSSGGTGSVKVAEVRNVGRVSWREVKRGN
ncbi:type IV pilus assembly protein PilY1 [Xanthomonas arboricola]|uniref:pilus assembly protein n=1 Tax=Xanthomonas campestris TaxID=339 RepID=UPI0023E92B68|nr:type IV pilus assembly protein PilY1 [Xanthomonas campestris]